MIYNHTFNGEILETLEINEDNLRDHIIKYETPPVFNKGRFERGYSLHFELSLLQYLYITQNYRYPYIGEYLRYGIITENSLHPEKYWEYFTDCLVRLEGINGWSYAGLKEEIKDSFK